jgi:hypothetical protein
MTLVKSLFILYHLHLPRCFFSCLHPSRRVLHGWFNLCSAAKGPLQQRLRAVATCQLATLILYMPSWRVQLPGGVPTSPPAACLRRTCPGVFFNSRSISKRLLFHVLPCFPQPEVGRTLLQSLQQHLESLLAWQPHLLRKFSTCYSLFMGPELFSEKFLKQIIR